MASLFIDQEVKIVMLGTDLSKIFKLEKVLFRPIRLIVVSPLLRVTWMLPCEVFCSIVFDIACMRRFLTFKVSKVIEASKRFDRGCKPRPAQAGRGLVLALSRR